MIAAVIGRAGSALLVVDGFLTAIVEALFLPLYLGATPFPISALAAAVINPLLVVGARSVTDRTALQALPLLAWVAGFLVCTFGGPGGDVVLVADWQALLLFVLGVAPASYVLYRGALS